MRTSLRAAAAAAVALLALTACGSGGDGDGKDGPVADGGSPVKGGQPGPAPRPDEAQKKQLVTAFEAIDPALAADPVRAVERGVMACEALAAGVPRKAVVEQTANDFGREGGTVLDGAEAERAVAAVEAAFCSVG